MENWFEKEYFDT